MTDRRIHSEEDLDDLDFGKQDGLVPVVAQDADSGDVLMVAWADRPALEATLRTGWMHFHSRSRDALWRKGETSGNVQRVRSLHADCDADTVLALVDPAGPACHTGERTCFGEGGVISDDRGPTGSASARPGAAPSGSSRVESGVVAELWSVLEARRRKRPEDSYTVRLLDDENLRLKKLGEETTELVVSLARDRPERVPEEAADLVYHLLVALLGAGVSLDELLAELEERRGG